MQPKLITCPRRPGRSVLDAPLRGQYTPAQAAAVLEMWRRAHPRIAEFWRKQGAI